jgi:hypothetical protein
MSKATSGGGINSYKVKSVGVKTGSKAKGIAPECAASIGIQRVTTRGYKEPVMPGPISVPLGNEVALNVGGGGPGAGRTVSKAGSQGTHGPVASNPIPAPRDILSDFGPNGKKG